MDSIIARIRNRGCVLMLDFDGVLSPIVKLPSEARMSSATRQALTACVKKMPVAIITGRTLPDIEKRVGLRDVIYAGSHGLEWKIDGRVHRKRIYQKTLSAFEVARRSLLRHAKLFPEMFVENKSYGLALGYRSLSTAQARRFRVGATDIVKKFDRTSRIRVIDNLYTFEIMPDSEWTKGDCARHIYNTTAKGSALAIYIGDGLTDEDAFRVFAKSGITIRVGKSHTSFAQYYFQLRSGVNRFLHNISDDTNPQKHPFQKKFTLAKGGGNPGTSTAFLEKI